MAEIDSDRRFHPARRAAFAPAAMIRFYSRIPLPRLGADDDPAAAPDFARDSWALPVAAVVIALPAAAVLWGAATIGLPPVVAAGLALVALVMTTGAFHEDGLADTADGFGGGWTTERKLEIMRDSRIGTYGGAALVLSLLLRASTLAALLDDAPSCAALALIAAAVASRTLALGLHHLLPAARAEGLAHRSSPGARTTWLAMTLAAAIVLVLGAPCLGPARIAGAALASLFAAAALGWLAWRQIGGRTGDVLGAGQQVAEIAFLVALLM